MQSVAQKDHFAILLGSSRSRLSSAGGRTTQLDFIDCGNVLLSAGHYNVEIAVTDSILLHPGGGGSLFFS